MKRNKLKQKKRNVFDYQGHQFYLYDINFCHRLLVMAISSNSFYPDVQENVCVFLEYKLYRVKKSGFKEPNTCVFFFP